METKADSIFFSLGNQTLMTHKASQPSCRLCGPQRLRLDWSLWWRRCWPCWQAARALRGCQVLPHHPPAASLLRLLSEGSLSVPSGALTRISHFVNSPFYQIPWKSLLYKTIRVESRVGGQDPYLPPSQRYPPDDSVSGAQFENHWPSRCWDQRKLGAYKHLEFAFLRQPCTASSALGALQDSALVRSSIGPMGKNLIPKPQKN